MYNPLKIEQLLRERGLKNKTLLEYLGYKVQGGLIQAVSGDIRVSKLEKISDFFGVPVDTFFDRECEANGTITAGGISPRTIADEREQALRDLLKEKNQRIALLEDMVAMLKAQLKVDEK